MNVQNKLFAVLVFMLGFLSMHETWLSIFTLWITTDTYMHGLFVPVLVFIIIWQMPKPSVEISAPSKKFSAFILIMWGALATLSTFTLISTLTQFFAIAMVPALLIAMYGSQWSWYYRAPLALWMFALPFGDFMIPYLQSITADMSVFLLQMSGVSVVRNGWYIRIPAADFRVAEACSGVNFLISTFTLSVFYSFMYMSSVKKRISFILLGALVPVLANGLRVYLIIMIAHWGNVEAATGFDHLVYGWIFFVFILVILLLVGRKMQDEVVLQPGPVAPPKTSSLKWTSVLILCVSISVSQMSYKPTFFSEKAFETQPTAVASIYPSASKMCINNTNKYQHVTYFYEEESTSSKLVSYENRVFDEQSWGLERRTLGVAVIDGRSQDVVIYDIINLNGERMKVYQSFRVDSAWHSSTLLLKWHQLIGKISGRDRGGEVHLWITPNTVQASTQSLTSKCM